MSDWLKLGQVADDLIAVLAADPNAVVRVTADLPDGASDNIWRAVDQNAVHLGFKTAEWEDRAGKRRQPVRCVMCGRFTLAVRPHRLASTFVLTGPVPDLSPRYNIPPTQDVAVVARRGDGSRGWP